MSAKPLVLIVDDDSDLLDLVGTCVKIAGYPVQIAATAADALRAISEGSPDTILLDYRIPGLAAAEFIHLARSKNPHMAVVLMSGIDDIDQKARSLGCQFSLKKPFAVTTLSNIIEQCHRTPRQSDGNK